MILGFASIHAGVPGAALAWGEQLLEFGIIVCLCWGFGQSGTIPPAQRSVGGLSGVGFVLPLKASPLRGSSCCRLDSDPEHSLSPLAAPQLTP